MSSDRSGRRSSLPVHQPTLLLGHGSVSWDTLPPDVRERALALWLQLLTAHRAHDATPGPVASPPQIGGPPR